MTPPPSPLPSRAATLEEFDRAARSGRSPATRALSRIKKPGGVRVFPNHDHRCHRGDRTCALAKSLQKAARRWGWLITTAHDGPDLYVKRIE